MQLLDLTLPTPEENLALDEALLDEAEEAADAGEKLRLWESPSFAVVVGRSSDVAVEVRREACAALGVPVLRRTSGGAAVVIGPGCLMYSLLLDLQQRPRLRMLDRAHCLVRQTLAAALCGLGLDVQPEGTSDLAAAGQKFSGNSARLKRRWLLYHGTLLYGFPLDLIGRLLATPPRQPEYRQGRAHAEFVANLPTSGSALRQAVAAAWSATEPCGAWPRDRVAELVAQRYIRKEWVEGSG